jgi:hypothetical protein
MKTIFKGFNLSPGKRQPMTAVIFFSCGSAFQKVSSLYDSGAMHG